jgi:hypothetical protein
MELSKARDIHFATWDPEPGFHERIVQAFYGHREDAHTRCSHFFQGRFENIIIPEHRIPGMSKLIEAVRTAAAAILACRPRALACGYWFNCMAPGQVTLTHNHDCDQERLSAVYYLRVPPACGDLLIHRGREVTRIVPGEGLCVLFHPALRHEVTENQSDSDRLSMAMNFGPVRDHLSADGGRSSVPGCAG